MDVLSFEDALAKSDEVAGNRHLLLGNGFSIACRPDLFRYDRLFDQADFSGLGVDADRLFALSGTTDFERVIQALEAAAGLVGLYDQEQTELGDILTQDAEALKEALAAVLSRQHPSNVGEIQPEEYASARRFLANFEGQIYTVSYDLLLYWTLLQDMDPDIASDDGFRSDPDDEDAEWVLWDGYAGHHQRVFYIHGGLHLYDAGATLKKITYARTGVSLVEQIRAALSEATYPLVVTEGSDAEKLGRIEHSPYLHRGLKSLNACGGSIFIHGHSLRANDEHVFRRIEGSKVRAAFVSIYGDPESAINRAIIARADLLASHRDENQAAKPAHRRKDLSITFYDAESAKVWDPGRQAA